MEAVQIVETKALTLVDVARAITIPDAAAFRAAGEFLVTCKEMQREIDGVMDPPIEAAHKSHKAAIAAKKKVSGPVEEAERIVKAKIVEWRAVEARELRRVAEEQSAAARKREEEERLAVAASLEDQGRGEEAMAILERPATVVAVAPPPAAIAQGVSVAKLYRADVVDLLALVRHVAANPENLGLLEANGAALNRLATSLKEGLNLPGVVLRIQESVRA